MSKSAPRLRVVVGDDPGHYFARLSLEILADTRLSDRAKLAAAALIALEDPPGCGRTVATNGQVSALAGRPNDEWAKRGIRELVAVGLYRVEADPAAVSRRRLTRIFRLRQSSGWGQICTGGGADLPRGGGRSAPPPGQICTGGGADLPPILRSSEGERNNQNGPPAGGRQTPPSAREEDEPRDPAEALAFWKATGWLDQPEASPLRRIAERRVREAERRLGAAQGEGRPAGPSPKVPRKPAPESSPVAPKPSVRRPGRQDEDS